MPEQVDSGPALVGFALADWLVVAAYLGLVLLIGVRAGRRAGGRDEFFLAGRRMPLGAVAVSVLATSLSAATFVGVPQLSYAGDLTYLAANLGGLLAVLVVAFVFVPAFYRHGVTSIYELLGDRLGPSARTAASAMFMIGRVFASGARLFIVAIPFALIAFGDTRPGSLAGAIVVIAATAAAYTGAGGIRAVIWTDVLQAIVVVSTVAIAVGLLWARIPLGAGEIVDALRSAPGGSKLRVIDLDLDPGRAYTLWSALLGLTFLNLAAFGTDQDLAQRLLTCRSARAGAWSVILANLIAWPVVLLFLIVGLLLFVHHQTAAGGVAEDAEQTRQVFVAFMLHEMPVGVRGLMAAGLFAAAMSSLDSALNAMASTTIADFYRPWRRRREATRRSPDAPPEPAGPDPREILASRTAIVGWAAALAGFAVGCVFWQTASGDALVDFALGVMVFAYAGLLGVFLTALLTPRGNAASAIAALATGFAAVLLMQDFAWSRWAPAIGIDMPVAFPWRMLVATALSFAVCCAGRRAS